jgi:hypothetical protein
MTRVGVPTLPVVEHLMYSSAAAWSSSRDGHVRRLRECWFRPGCRLIVMVPRRRAGVGTTCGKPNVGMSVCPLGAEAWLDDPFAMNFAPHIEDVSLAAHQVREHPTRARQGSAQRPRRPPAATSSFSHYSIPSNNRRSTVALSRLIVQPKWSKSTRRRGHSRQVHTPALRLSPLPRGRGAKPCGHADHVGTCPACPRAALQRAARQLAEATIAWQVSQPPTH